MTQQRLTGAQSGAINNPKGINQYTGLVERGRSISCRLPIELDRQFRAIIDDEGITATTALVEAVEMWMSEKSR